MQIVKNKIEWNKILKTNFQELMDVYFRYEYFNLYSKTYEVLPEALFWENKKIKIFWSHLIRKINNIDLYKDYTYNDLTTPYGYGGPLILPKVDDNTFGRWRWGYNNKTISKLETEVIVINSDNGISLYKKQRPKIGDLPVKKPKSIFYKPEYSSGNGTAQLESFFGKKVFDNPKPLALIKDLIFLTTEKTSLILDFFAGSGTTAHAILELNKEYNGKRKFILITNNENNNGYEGGIAESICYPRIQKVINGYRSNSGKIVSGLGTNLKYFRTDFIPYVRTDADKRELTARCTELLCVAEHTFEEIIIVQDQFSIFENNHRITAIIYDEDYIEVCKSEIKKHNKPTVVYVFSYDKEYNQEDFNDLCGEIEIKPIPEAILNVYRRMVRKLER